METSSLIQQAKEKGWLHLFLVVNPISAMVTKLIIDNYGLKEEKIMVLTLRGTDTSSLSISSEELDQKWFDKFLIKLFQFQPLSNRVKKEISKTNKNFILYSSWAYKETFLTPSVPNILSSDFCRGHMYIEEGQVTYRPSKPYLPKQKLRDNADNAENLKDVFRNDAEGYFSILEDAFPLVPNEKKILLSNYKDLLETYEPRLEGISKIGLTCAERRINKNQWKSMLQNLMSNMREGGVVKLHPSFTYNKKTRMKITSIFNEISPDSISLCDDKVILEIEMLHEKKTLFGPLSSLNKYAKVFGSEFIDIQLF